MTCNSEWVWQLADVVPGDENGNERGCNGQVSDGRAASPVGQGDNRRRGGQVVAGHHGIGSVQREVGSGATHRYPDRGSSHAGASLTPSPTSITFARLPSVHILCRPCPAAAARRGYR